MLEGDSHIDTAAARGHEEASEAHLSSRRNFERVGQAAGRGRTGAGVGGGTGLQGNDDHRKGDDEHGGKINGKNGVSDVDILNYALVLERLEAEFYRRFLDKYNERQIEGRPSSTALATRFAPRSTRTWC